MSKTKQVLYSSSNYITTQDVPDELALAISLSGCPIHCKGCHSAFTWNPFFGELLTDDMFRNIIKKNKYASCVLFYGGEWQLERLLELIDIAKAAGKDSSGRTKPVMFLNNHFCRNQATAKGCKPPKTVRLF